MAFFERLISSAVQQLSKVADAGTDPAGAVLPGVVVQIANQDDGVSIVGLLTT